MNRVNFEWIESTKKNESFNHSSSIFCVIHHCLIHIIIMKYTYNRMVSMVFYFNSFGYNFFLVRWKPAIFRPKNARSFSLCGATFFKQLVLIHFFQAHWKHITYIDEINASELEIIIQSTHLPTIYMRIRALSVNNKRRKIVKSMFKTYYIFIEWSSPNDISHLQMLFEIHLALNRKLNREINTERWEKNE